MKHIDDDIIIGRLYKSPGQYLLLWTSVSLARQALILKTADCGATIAAQAWTTIQGGSYDDEDDFTMLLANAIRAGLQAELKSVDVVERWGRALGRKPICIKPHDIFMVVDCQRIDNKHFYKVIFGNQIGWIIWNDHVEFCGANE